MLSCYFLIVLEADYQLEAAVGNAGHGGCASVLKMPGNKRKKPGGKRKKGNPEGREFPARALSSSLDITEREQNKEEAKKETTSGKYHSE